MPIGISVAAPIVTPIGGETVGDLNPLVEDIWDDWDYSDGGVD